MTDSWDRMLADTDEELITEIRSDMAAYTARLLSGNTAGCVQIEQKYGLYGLSPQQVSEQLHEMTLPIGGVAS
jgi:hypothetical protein